MNGKCGNIFQANMQKALPLLILANPQMPLDLRNTWEETWSYISYRKGGVATGGIRQIFAEGMPKICSGCYSVPTHKFFP